ncbi:prepilin peptidase CpaA [Paenibacillus qinlingensis]|uniref:Prepilin peptidase CpaA n=1 Tax=Paenibacillus qinlingensis TaxID=1837343 RepID=A0ABU1NS32_9BACL|nr:prepilin peptidase CpaA [Paenibacillus qinlingensis]
MIGIVLHTMNEGWEGLIFAFLGSGTGLVVVLFLYVIGALGAGDVKLFAAIGAFMGVAFVMQTLVYAILCAGIIGLILLLIQKQMRTTSEKLRGWLISICAYRQIDTLFELKHQKNIKFPFMYAVAPSVAVTWYYSLL